MERGGEGSLRVGSGRDRPQELDFVRIDGTECRLALSFPTAEERTAPVLPDVVTDESGTFATTLYLAVDDLLVATL